MRYYLVDVAKHNSMVEITEELAKHITGNREADKIVKIGSYCSSVHRWFLDKNTTLVVDGFEKE